MASRPVSESIPNLINGVSQQPAALRLASQAAAQVNTYPSVVEGLKQRPPTNHLAKVLSGTLGNAYIHTINRDTAERYIVIVTNGGIRVFDLAGVEKTVNFSSRTQVLQFQATATGDGVEQIIYLPSGVTTATIETTIETTATVTWETSANGLFTDTVTLATHSVSAEESKTITSGHTIRARISSWTSGIVTAQVTWKATNYLVNAAPNVGFLATSIADYTFLVNKGVTVEMDESVLSDEGPRGALISVKQVANNVNYKVFVDGTEQADYTAPATGAVSTATVAADLKTDLTTNLTGVTDTHIDNQGGEGLTSTPVQFTATGLGNVTLTTRKKGFNGTILWEKSTTGAFAGEETTFHTVTGTGTPFTTDDTHTAAWPAANYLRARISNQVDPSDKTTATASYGSSESWFVDRESYALHLYRDSRKAFEVKVQDSEANTYLNAAVTSVQQFSKLPTVAPRDFVVEVVGDQSSSFDNYFVKFVPSNSISDFDEGTWNETVKPAIPVRLKPHTMPHTLVREADGTFTFGSANWGERVVGDETSAPNPSFVGEKINDIFFHKNRLGFLADDNVIMSRAGEFFEFFPTTVTTLLDSDPVDVAATDSSGDGASVSILRHAMAFDETLLLFSDQAQFILKGGDLLTPKTASIDVVTEYEADVRARPVGSGKNVFFPVPNGDFSGLREMFVEAETLVKDAADVTAHVPAYVPKTPIRLAGASNEGIIVILAEGDQTKLWPYKFYWSGDSKLQSAWSEWGFNGDTVLNADFIENTLYILFQRSDGVYLESMDVQPKLTDPDQAHLAVDKRYLTHLDRRVTEADCSSVTYDSATDKTTWTLPYEVKSGQAMQIVTRAHTSALDKPGIILQGIEVDGMDATKLKAMGDWSNANNKVFIGEVYEASYTFSQQVLKEQARGGGENVIGSARIDMKLWSLVYDKTGYFRVEVTHEHRPTPSVYKFTGRIMGAPSNKLGEISLPTGTFKFPVLSRADKVTIKVITDHFLPMALQNAEWTAEVSIQFPRAR